MTNNVGLTFSVGDTIPSNVALNKTIRLGGTKYHVLVKQLGPPFHWDEEGKFPTLRFSSEKDQTNECVCVWGGGVCQEQYETGMPRHTMQGILVFKKPKPKTRNKTNNRKTRQITEELL